MKLLGALFAMVLIVTVLAVATLVQLAITLAPFLMGALVVVLVIRARRSRSVFAGGRGWPDGGYPRRVAPQPHYRVGAPAAAPGRLGDGAGVGCSDAGPTGHRCRGNP